MTRPQRNVAQSNYTRYAIGLGIFLLVAPWLGWFFTLPPSATPALVAVPANGRGLSASVAPGFADAPYFVVVGLSSPRVQTIENPYRSAEAVGIKSAHRMLDEGVGVLLVRSLRREPLGALNARGVRVFAGGGGSVGEIVQAFVNGRLAPLSSAASALVRTAAPEPGRQMADVEPNPTARGAPMWAPSQVGATRLPAPVQAAIPSTATPSSFRRPGSVPELGFDVALAPAGLLVVGVVPRSRAQRAGLRDGDLLLGLGPAPVRSIQQLEQAARVIATDRPVAAWLERGGVRAQLWIPP